MESDIELMLRAKSGDDGAFSELMRRHYKGVVNFAYRFTRALETSEDLAQEVFLRVYRSREKYKPEAKFTTWLYKIASNVCLTYVSRQKKGGVSLDDPDANTGDVDESKDPKADEMLYRKEIKEAVMSALESLPEREKIAIMLCKYEGFSYEEVAEVIGCSVGAVKSYVHRGRMKLITLLEPHLIESEKYGM